MLRRGALLNFDKQNGGEQNPIHSYANCAPVNDLVMLLCSTQLTYRLHPGVSHGVTFKLIPNRIGFCHGQISIETATYSLSKELTQEEKKFRRTGMKPEDE